MANYFKRLDKEKARGQDVGYQEYLLTHHTIYIGFGGRRPDPHAEALQKATTYQNLASVRSVEYDPIPDELFNDWETSLAIGGLEELISNS